jgi:polyphosphate kinase 2 (PPK2 family)
MPKHDFLWRTNRCLPPRGKIGIFNRSYHEEVLVVRVHPELLGKQRIPEELCGEHAWRHRFEDIQAFEAMEVPQTFASENARTTIKTLTKK